MDHAHHTPCAVQDMNVALTDAPIYGADHMRIGTMPQAHRAGGRPQMTCRRRIFRCQKISPFPIRCQILHRSRRKTRSRSNPVRSFHRSTADIQRQHMS